MGEDEEGVLLVVRAGPNDGVNVDVEHALH